MKPHNALLVFFVCACLGVAYALSPRRTEIVQTYDGPGQYTLDDAGALILDWEYCFDVESFDDHLGELVEVAFQRAGPNPGAYSNDYFAENVTGNALPNYLHVWPERGYFTSAPFDGLVPDAEIRLSDTEYVPGWTYTWPSTGYTTLAAYDGTTDFAGTSGYSGHIDGVTNSSVWVVLTDPDKVKTFAGNGTDLVTVYYSPRTNDYISGEPSGHWGPHGTTITGNVTYLKVRYKYKLS